MAALTGERPDERLVSPLGQPVPNDDHATSVSMPLWKHVCGYEEGDTAVIEALAVGYPRFVYHPYVSQLSELIAAASGLPDELAVLPFPMMQVAERCVAFLQQVMTTNQHLVRAEALSVAGAAFVVFPKEAAALAKAYWQHTGEGCSSRHCETALRALGADPTQITERFNNGQRVCVVPADASVGAVPEAEADVVRMGLKQRIAGLTAQPVDNVFLCASGMAAIFTALCSARRLAEPGAKAVVFGFPYLDTLKMCRRPEWCDGCLFYGHGDGSDLAALTAELEAGQTRVVALFTEFPSNPLLKCPPLPALRVLADRFAFPIVVDDTISNFANCDFLGSGAADVVVTSLTKLFSGAGDAMGGSLVANANTTCGAAIAQDLRTNFKDTLFHADAAVILTNAQDFEQRSAAINVNSQALVDWLVQQPGVKTVHYPSLTTQGRETYGTYMREGAGFAGLFSLICDSTCHPQTFYNALAVQKGPSLGTNYTLASPYTLLAHYGELEWASGFGVQADLVRVAVGVEDLQTLKDKFSYALDQGRTAVTRAAL